MGSATEIGPEHLDPNRSDERDETRTSRRKQNMKVGLVVAFAIMTRAWWDADALSLVSLKRRDPREDQPQHVVS